MHFELYYIEMANTTVDDSLAGNGECSEGKPANLSEEGVKEWERLGGLCDEHLGEVIVFFCHDCSKASCTICSMRYHHQHKKSYMDMDGADEGSFGHTGIFFPPEFTLDGLLKKLNEDLQVFCA